jgi:hypothetical protein
VFLPYVIGTSQRGTISGISGSVYDSAAMGAIYTVPDGGPYTATTSDYLILPAITINDATGQTLVPTISPQTRSESLARFQIGAVLPFSGHCRTVEEQADFTATGLVIGESYELRGSVDLINWELLESFTAIANAHSYQEPVSEGPRYFQLIKAE